MIKVSVIYPNENGAKFDMDYYVNKHVPLCEEFLGDAMARKLEIDEGVAGGMPGSAPPFVAAVHMYFDSLDAFQKAFAPYASKILKDIPNYTSIKPITQIAEVR